MADYYVMAETRSQVRRRLAMKGDVKKISVDFSSWVDDNGTVTSVTWTTESGQASIGTKTLSSNVASAILTTSEAGGSMLKITATDGTHTEALYIRVLTKDPQAVTAIPDYGLLLA